LKAIQNWLEKAREYVEALDLVAQLETSHTISLITDEGERA